MTDARRHIAVLGGGVAGLAAAWRLLQLKPHWQVTILEEAEHLGGLAAAWKLGKFSADLGPHRIYTELPEIKALLPELINPEESLTVKRQSQILIDGRYYQYPVQPKELLRHMGPVRVAEFGAGVATGKIQGLLSRHVADYRQAMIQAFGSGAYKYIIGPYTEKVWKIRPEELSPDVARVRVSAGNASRLMSQWFTRQKAEARPTSLKEFTYIRGGVQGLVDSLRQKVENAGGSIRTGCIVAGLQGESGHVSSVVTHQCAPPVPVDGVISTVPLPDLVEMVSNGKVSTGDSAGALETAEQLEYIGLILVAVMVNKPQVTPNSWIYFPEDKYVFNRAYEPGNFDPSMKPAGQSMLVLEVTARWDSDLWKRRNADISEQVTRDGIAAGLFTQEDVIDAAALRVPHAYPLYTRDYRVKLQRLFDYLRPVKNLVSTGRQGLFNHNNMDHSILMGLRSAETLAENLNGANMWYSNLDQFSHFRIVD